MIFYNAFETYVTRHNKRQLRQVSLNVIVVVINI